MSDTDRSAIARASARLLNAVNSSDVDAVLAVWAEDGVMMPVSSPSGVLAPWRVGFGRGVALSGFIDPSSLRSVFA